MHCSNWTNIFDCHVFLILSYYYACPDADTFFLPVLNLKQLLHLLQYQYVLHLLLLQMSYTVCNEFICIYSLSCCLAGDGCQWFSVYFYMIAYYSVTRYLKNTAMLACNARLFLLFCLLCLWQLPLLVHVSLKEMWFLLHLTCHCFLMQFFILSVCSQGKRSNTSACCILPHAAFLFYQCALKVKGVTFPLFVTPISLALQCITNNSSTLVFVVNSLVFHSLLKLDKQL
jgi:hypothetical protein